MGALCVQAFRAVFTMLTGLAVVDAGIIVSVLALAHRACEGAVVTATLFVFGCCCSVIITAECFCCI